MNKIELKKYAEAGVRVRLQEIQAELNQLYREFPEIVGNVDGSLPVLPLTAKKKKPHTLTTNGHGRYLYTEDKLNEIRTVLASHPGIRTNELHKALGGQGSLGSLRDAIRRAGGKARNAKASVRIEREWVLKKKA